MTDIRKAIESAVKWLDENGGAHVADDLREALKHQEADSQDLTIAYMAGHAKGVDDARSALAQGVETDTTRLEFMQFYGAQVCWGNDSEVCYVRWHTHWGEQELRRTSKHNDWRVAIDEAIEMEKKP